MSDAPPRHSLRPPPLRLSKASRKIRKQQISPPPPVVIQVISPKTIHVHPNEFMSLVQRLTGPDSLSPTPNTLPPASSATFRQNIGGGGGGCPAASVETQVLDGGGVEMAEELSWHANDSNGNTLSCVPHLNIDLHGNVNLNNYLGNNVMGPRMMNLPFPSNLDLFNSFPYI